MKDLNTYCYLKDLVNDCGGIEKFRFFGHLDKYDMVTPFGFALASYSDDWVDLDFYEKIGIDIIKSNKFAVSTMAGGQGTRLRL